MAKPILVTRVPIEFSQNESMERILNHLNIACSDYNNLVVPSRVDEIDIEFEVFNVQDYPQIEFDKLKQQLEDEFIKA